MDAISRLDQASSLDGLVAVGQRAARLIPPGGFRDALHGTWLGHPLHPMLVQAAAGTWLSASILDLSGGDDPAARGLTSAGLAASLVRGATTTPPPARTACPRRSPVAGPSTTERREATASGTGSHACFHLIVTNSGQRCEPLPPVGLGRPPAMSSTAKARCGWR
jgi:hypothetical protein